MAWPWGTKTEKKQTTEVLVPPTPSKPNSLSDPDLHYSGPHVEHT